MHSELICYGSVRAYLTLKITFINHFSYYLHIQSSRGAKSSGLVSLLSGDLELFFSSIVIEFALVKDGHTISLNIYGPSNYIIYENVARILGDAHLFLQTPSFIRHGMRYDNPQWLYGPSQIRDLTKLVKLTGEEIASWSAADIRRVSSQRTNLESYFVCNSSMASIMLLWILLC